MAAPVSTSVSRPSGDDRDQGPDLARVDFAVAHVGDRSHDLAVARGILVPGGGDPGREGREDKDRRECAPHQRR